MQKNGFNFFFNTELFNFLSLIFIDIEFKAETKAIFMNNNKLYFFFTKF